MRDKTEYRSAIRSRRMIRDAFLKLLSSENLSKITVTDIVKLADINRSTFYAHYPDVRGVIEEIENEIIGKMFEILGEFKYQSFFANPTSLLLKISRYLEEDENFYRVLIQSNGASTFLEKLKVVFVNYMKSDVSIPENIRSSKKFELRIFYFSGGIVNMYQQWFSGKLNCSLNDIALEVGQLISMDKMLVDKGKAIG